MSTAVRTNREDIQDVWYGQIVIIMARWFVIAAGVMLTLWRADQIQDITGVIYPLIGLVALNFFMHGRIITGSPIRRELILVSSIVDVALISVIVATASWKADSGIENPFYVFYYPVLLAFALVFPWRFAIPFGGAAIATYVAIVLSTGLGDDPTQAHETLVARAVTLASITLLGNLYWRIQRTWRLTHVGGAESAADRVPEAH
jgi:hypothetical protein